MSYSMSLKLNQLSLLLISTCIAAPIGYASEGSSKQVNDGILQEIQYSKRIMDVIKRELEANKKREYSDTEIVSILNFGARLMSPLSINDMPHILPFGLFDLIRNIPVAEQDDFVRMIKPLYSGEKEAAYIVKLISEFAPLTLKERAAISKMGADGFSPRMSYEHKNAVLKKVRSELASTAVETELQVAPDPAGGSTRQGSQSLNLGRLVIKIRNGDLKESLRGISDAKILSALEFGARLIPKPLDKLSDFQTDMLVNLSLKISEDQQKDFEDKVKQLYGKSTDIDEILDMLGVIASASPKDRHTLLNMENNLSNPGMSVYLKGLMFSFYLSLPEKLRLPFYDYSRELFEEFRKQP